MRGEDQKKKESNTTSEITHLRSSVPAAHTSPRDKLGRVAPAQNPKPNRPTGGGAGGGRALFACMYLCANFLPP